VGFVFASCTHCEVECCELSLPVQIALGPVETGWTECTSSVWIVGPKTPKEKLMDA